MTEFEIQPITYAINDTVTPEMFTDFVGRKPINQSEMVKFAKIVQKNLISFMYVSSAWNNIYEKSAKTFTKRKGTSI